LQKDTKHYYKAKIISKIIDHGIFAPCYVGNWSVVKGATIELHKFWFIMMITIVVLEAPRGSMQLVGPLCILYGMCKKGIISLKMK
jgi:hypothetical protein